MGTTNGADWGGLHTPKRQKDRRGPPSALIEFLEWLSRLDVMVGVLATTVVLIAIVMAIAGV